MHRTPVSRFAALGVAGATAVAGLGVALPSALGPGRHAGRLLTRKTPTSRGFGGAVTSVDPEASRVGLQVLKHGGNAVDAAVATAAALGVTEPYSSGHRRRRLLRLLRRARPARSRTIDGRETAPPAMPHDAFIDPTTGKPYNFTPELVTSGVSVGVPGTPATWDKALKQWGTLVARPGARARPPAGRAAASWSTRRSASRPLENEARFAAFTSTRKLFLPGGDAPAVGLGLPQPRPRRRPTELIGASAARGVLPRPARPARSPRPSQHPPKSRDTDAAGARRATWSAATCARYRRPQQAPTHVELPRATTSTAWRRRRPAASTVGEALNILERFRPARR